MIKNNLTGLVISAGLSGRMNSFKPLLELNGKSFLQIILEKLFLVCNEVVIVTGFNSTKIHEELEKKHLKNNCKLVHNENYSSGMFSSLKLGLNHISSKWILFHFVDQPTLPEKFYFDFSSILSDTHDWFQPVNKGRKGHPIIFNDFVKNLIISSIDNSNLRIISQNPEIKKFYFNCNFTQIFDDIDEPKDFQQILNENKFQRET